MLQPASSQNHHKASWTSRLYNTPQGFGYGSITFHWVMAALVIGLLSVGLYMVSLPSGPDKLKIYGLHKATGMLVLMLVTLRVLWKFKNVTPSLEGLPSWQIHAARLSHGALYFFMFAMPLIGWMLTSRAGYPISFFGLFVIPTLAEADPQQRELFALLHKYSAYTLILLILIHTAAAFKHHFVDKDSILKRMLIPPQV